MCLRVSICTTIVTYKKKSSLLQSYAKIIAQSGMMKSMIAIVLVQFALLSATFRVRLKCDFKIHSLLLFFCFFSSYFLEKDQCQLI